MKKNIRTALIILAVFFIIAILVCAGLLWYQNKMVRVANGTARPTFPYSDRSIQELEKLYPQYIENTAPTTQTPEQTHQKFIAALKKGDFDEAVECCVVKEDHEKIKEGLQKVKEKGELEQMIRDLDTEIEIGSGQTLKNLDEATYYYSSFRDGKKLGSTIDFTKNFQGVWLIESL